MKGAAVIVLTAYFALALGYLHANGATSPMAVLDDDFRLDIPSARRIQLAALLETVLKKRHVSLCIERLVTEKNSLEEVVFSEESVPRTYATLLASVRSSGYSVSKRPGLLHLQSEKVKAAGQTPLDQRIGEFSVKGTRGTLIVALNDRLRSQGIDVGVTGGIHGQPVREFSVTSDPKSSFREFLLKMTADGGPDWTVLVSPSDKDPRFPRPYLSIRLGY